MSTVSKHQMNHDEFEELRRQILEASLSDKQITDLAITLKEKFEKQ